jgi:ATP phosphoribosyltransferase regulatory subunit
MATKFRYPTGVRALLVDETARRRRIESRFVALLERARFQEVLLPIIDYVEPYSKLVDRDAARQGYRFVDREGELVAIRSDFTPMVARALAPALRREDLPLRILYRGDVIRVEATRLGVNREIFQIGAEVIGDDSVEADVDVLLLAASCLADFGIRPLVVYNDTSIAAALVASTPAAGDAVRAALISKRSGELGNLRGAIEPDARLLIERLATGAATLDDVAAYRPCAAAAERLRRIETGLRGVDSADFVLHLDDIDAAAVYYTGIRFRIYSHDARTRLAQGGRYDELYGRFGTAAPAIGFTFTIDDVDENVASSGGPLTKAAEIPAFEVNP